MFMLVNGELVRLEEVNEQIFKGEIVTFIPNKIKGM